MFLIYVNDIPNRLKSYMGMFADDTELTKTIQSERCYEDLQRDLDKLCN